MTSFSDFLIWLHKNWKHTSHTYVTSIKVRTVGSKCTCTHRWVSGHSIQHFFLYTSTFNNKPLMLIQLRIYRKWLKEVVSFIQTKHTHKKKCLKKSVAIFWHVVIDIILTYVVSLCCKTHLTKTQLPSHLSLKVISFFISDFFLSTFHIEGWNAKGFYLLHNSIALRTLLLTPIDIYEHNFNYMLVKLYRNYN